MRKRHVVSLSLVVFAIVFISFKNSSQSDYIDGYSSGLARFRNSQQLLLNTIVNADPTAIADRQKIQLELVKARGSMKAMDFWFRYLDPLAYKSINGPLPVEWETEVFEKFEKPYRRDGAGLTLASLCLDEQNVDKDTLLQLVRLSLDATEIFAADSTTDALGSFHHFYLCNRLFLLNLAAIYTTGFECPTTTQIIPELQSMLAAVDDINRSFNNSFPATPVSSDYLMLFERLISFVKSQPDDYTKFDHFTFIKDYVNPLFIINQRAIKQYHVVSRSLVDYSLNKDANSIFDKALYNGQDGKGVFLRVKETAALTEIARVGKLLFYDPILSGNNKRSCASCHKAKQYFADTSFTTPLHFDGSQYLPRNAPSLVNAPYNHLVMLDGRHISLQNQSKDVITNPTEMGGSEQQVLTKVMSCKEYKLAFQQLLKYTPQENTVTLGHIVSSITYYYSQFSNYYSPFDDAMNKGAVFTSEAKAGFNLFMGKAQCGTCHFIPQFNGVKPPYVGSEFEVLGVPADTSYHALDKDEGRYAVFAAQEMKNAFRTGSVRNAQYTRPYMHNGVFNSLEQVVDFYDAGGGAGRGLVVANQTLSADSLGLTKVEKTNLIAFIHSLGENVIFEEVPTELPKSGKRILNDRVVGGVY